MADLRTILCPVDFSTATERQVGVAAELCRRFGAKLVVQHNLDTPAPGAAVGWMWSEGHHSVPSESADEQRLRALLATLPEGVMAEARITHGPPSTAVLIVAEMIEADLVVLSTHGREPEEHTSVTERVLERSRCGVLALHESTIEGAAPHFASRDDRPWNVLVPVSFSGGSRPAVEFAFDLARKLPIELHLLHIGGPDAESSRQLAAIVPEDLAPRVHLHVDHGDPPAAIAAAAARVEAAWIVMGEHRRTTLRRWFTRDTGVGVLHYAHCPVWYVPEQPRHRGVAATG